MSAAISLAMAWVCLSAAPADEGVVEAPFSYPRSIRFLTGFARIPGAREGTGFTLTGEYAAHTLGGVLSNGFSLTSAAELTGRWTVITPGIYLKVDVTYLFASGLWAVRPPDDFPFRLSVGSRLGLGLSDSYPDRASQTTYAPSYVLFRAELQPFFDFEWPLPLGHRREYALVIRGSIDAPVTLNGDPFRWGFSAGLSYGWRNE